MSRTTLLQERRMQTFQNVLGHWQARRLSALEAAEMLGMSERSFRRYRRRYEDDGLDGLFDRRLDKASARRVPADRIEWVLEQYRTRHTGWTVKHFHGLCCKLGEGAMRDQGASCSPYDSALARRSCSNAIASVRAHGPRAKARSTIRASPTMPPWRANIPAWPLRSARITSKPLIVA